MPSLTEPIQVGKREDLADIYSIVDMKATPFTTRVNKSAKATNSEFDWIVDNYQSPNTNGTVDGTDVAAFENAAVNRGRLGNVIQVFRRSAKVSRLAEDLSNVAGVRSEIALASAKKLVELKRDQEYTFLGTNDGQLDDGTKPYLTVGLDTWINTTGPTVPKAVPSIFRTNTTQIITTATASVSEDVDIQALLTAIYDNTGMNGDYVLFAGSVLRRRVTDCTRYVANVQSTSVAIATKVRTFTQSAVEPKITSTTSVFEGDYGTFEVVSSNFIGQAYATGAGAKGMGYLLDMDKIHLRSNKTPSVERFPDLGGGPRILVEAIAGLQVDNPIGLGKFKPAS